jgi:predicted alpha/beta-hydrolase family hydrolase
MTPRKLSIAIDGGAAVSGLWLQPAEATACLVLAHGAGAGMAHKSMIALADGLAARGIASLRYQFPYMERGSRRPDAPKLAHAAVREREQWLAELRVELEERDASLASREHDARSAAGEAATARIDQITDADRSRP